MNARQIIIGLLLKNKIKSEIITAFENQTSYKAWSIIK